MLKAFMERNLADMPLCQTCDIPYGDYDNDNFVVTGELTKAARRSGLTMQTG
jgi:hypothetical protein